ncbi:hypothetical protein [Prauserella muralis]|uniref:hypothetical protein n=1 Tax=Prauserella muralis TaxID=588067 RepID=UPI0011AD58C7|nr:hypothetical protein [Prauserella muralis]TWE29880.1 hypothetical protein FHX69_2572 [Prauserella muralis]
MIRAPFRIRPRDFDALEAFAAAEPALAEAAEGLAWQGDRFSWGAFFAALREFRALYA